MKNMRVFSKLSLTIILLVFFITLISTIVSSQVSSYAIKNETYNYSMTFLNKLNSLIENELSGINRVVTKFCRANIDDENIVNNMQDQYERYLLYKDIDKLIESNTYIDSIYIFFDQGKKVYFQSIKSMANVNGIMETEKFFDRETYYSFLNSSYLSEIIGARGIKPNYYEREVRNADIWRVISFIKRIPVNELYTRDAAIVNIDESYLLKLISGNYMPEKSIIFVSNQRGDVILSYYQGTNRYIQLQNEDIEKILNFKKSSSENRKYLSLKINNENCCVTRLYSGSSDWIYSLVIPEKELFRPVNTVNFTIFLFSTLILIFGILLSILIDKKFFQPVLRILQTLKSKGMDRCGSVHNMIQESSKAVKNNEFKQIEVYIDNIISKNANQEKQLQNYFSYYKERMLYALLNGDSQAVNMLENEQIIFANGLKRYNVILVNFRKKHNSMEVNDYNTVGVNAFIMDVIFRLSIYGQIEKVQINNQRTALLLIMETSVEMSTLTDHIKEMLVGNLQNSFIYDIAVGNICDSMKNINQSFIEAERILFHLQDSENSQVLSANEPVSNLEKVCSYPEKIENQIIKNIQLQDSQKVKAEICMFYNYIKEQGVNLRKVKKHSFVLIYNISLKLNELIKNNNKALLIDNIFDGIETLYTVQQIEAWMTEIIMMNLLNRDDKESGSNNKELIEKVVKYINVHYMEDIGLNTIADYVYLSPSYLGKIFKEVSGISFTDYLIKVRMETAIDLLINKSVNISEIVNKVGYYSIQSFSRVFRNYYKCSPSEYRRKNATNFLDTG